MISLIAAMTGAGIFLIIAFLVLFILGFVIKKLKFILWIAAVIALIAAVYFVFTG